MRSAISLGLGLSLAAFAISSTTAATHKTKIKHYYNYDIHAVAKPLVAPPSQRVCDWVGPGGRAVYRCTVVEPKPQRVTMEEQPTHVCGWIGPPRAIYACR